MATHSSVLAWRIPGTGKPSGLLSMGSHRVGHDSSDLAAAAEVVKQEMARVNIDILGISELKWTGMGKFNSDDHYIYYCRQESFRRNGVALTVNKRVWNAVFGYSLKNDRMICLLPRQTTQYHSNLSLCPNHWCQRCWSWAGLEKSVRSTRTDTKKMFFLHRGLEWK